MELLTKEEGATSINPSKNIVRLTIVWLGLATTTVHCELATIYALKYLPSLFPVPAILDIRAVQAISCLCFFTSHDCGFPTGAKHSFKKNKHQTVTPWPTDVMELFLAGTCVFERWRVSLPVRSWDCSANNHVEKLLRHFGGVQSWRAIDLQCQRQHPLED